MKNAKQRLAHYRAQTAKTPMSCTRPCGYTKPIKSGWQSYAIGRFSADLAFNGLYFGNWQNLKRGKAYYIANVDNWRFVGFCDEIARSVKHEGWYADDSFDETCRGLVLQLPARNGKAQYVPAYRFSSDDDGATCFPADCCDTALDAALLADEYARIAAEHEIDFQRARRDEIEGNDEQD